MRKNHKCFIPIAVFWVMYIIGINMIAAFTDFRSLKASVLPVPEFCWAAVCLCAAIILYRLLYGGWSVKNHFIKYKGGKAAFHVICCFIIGVAFHFFSQWVVFLQLNIIDVEYYEKQILHINNFPSHLYIVLLGPILEEIVVRGCFITRCRFEFGYKFAIVSGAVIWALMHFNVYQFLYVFVFGIVLNIIFFETDSLLYTVIIHIANNVGGILIFRQEVRAAAHRIFGGSMGDLFIIVIAGMAVAAGSILLIHSARFD